MRSTVCSRRHISYSVIQGGLSGYGIIDAGNNINADPLFVDGIHDLHSPWLAGHRHWHQ